VLDDKNIRIVLKLLTETRPLILRANEKMPYVACGKTRPGGLYTHVIPKTLNNERAHTRTQAAPRN
jgi:hypothetical protein